MTTNTGRLPEESERRTLKYGLILILIAVVSVFHFVTSTEYRYLHEIYQRIYYMPILLAAFWFGPVTGFLCALLVSAIYSIHIQLHWHHYPIYTFNQYAEIILYHVVALTIGFLSHKERRQRKKLEATSRQLSEAYAQLQNTFEQLRKADRLAALGELSAGIAHEIRNPLGSIKGSIEIIEGEFSQNHPKREFLDIIKEESARLNSIVSEFLKFARPPRPSIELTHLGDTINSTLTLISKEAASGQVQVERNIDDDIPQLKVDPDQIRQVLLNVMLNALAAMPKGGLLQVSARYDKDRKVVTVEISDSGIGISDQHMEHIFDPFFSTKPDGTGLGLSISYQLIENHGGRIWASSTEGSGATIYIELPVTDS